MRNKDEFKVAFLNRFFRSHNVMLEPYTLQAATIFADLRGQHGVKPMDALHLSCAAAAGVDLFLTNDIALTRLNIHGIGSIAASTPHLKKMKEITSVSRANSHVKPKIPQIFHFK